MGISLLDAIDRTAHMRAGGKKEGSEIRQAVPAQGSVTDTTLQQLQAEMAGLKKSR